MGWTTISTGAGFLPSTVPPLKSGFIGISPPQELGPKLFFLFHLPWNQKKHVFIILLGLKIGPKNQGMFEHTVDGRKNMEHLPLFTGFYTSQVVFPRISEPSTGSHPRIGSLGVSWQEITEAAMRGELDFFGSLKSRVALLKGEGFWFFFLLGGWDHGIHPSIPWRIPMGMVYHSYIWVHQWW